MLTRNQIAPTIEARSISDQHIHLRALGGRNVLVKFHRFSACPVARRQIDEFIERQGELNAAGIETVVLLHSSKEKLRRNFREVPGLHIIADRYRTFYRLFQSQFLLKKLFSIASWRETIAALLDGYLPQFQWFEGGMLAVPSDFLLDTRGRIVDLHYGTHFGDSWTVSDVLRKKSDIQP